MTPPNIPPHIPIVDANVLATLSRQVTPHAIPKLISLYLSDTEKLVTRIKTTATKGDLINAARAAHALKGSSGAYGAMQTHHMAKTIETDCQSKNQKQAITHAAHLITITKNTAAALQKTAQDYKNTAQKPSHNKE